MSMESSQSKKMREEKERGVEMGGKVPKKKNQVERTGWAVCICDVCVLCLLGTAALLSVE